eukprot:scaffold309_cov136-Isochrysis_galbana.AAC.2
MDLPGACGGRALTRICNVRPSAAGARTEIWSACKARAPKQGRPRCPARGRTGAHRTWWRIGWWRGGPPG